MALHQKDIEFSIVSGSNEEMLIGCMESLYSTMGETEYIWSLTVTCNGARDRLPERLRESHPDARVIVNDTPRGFAANHNRVVGESDARYVWLLNDDLLILPDTIQKITEYMDEPANSRVAVVSPRLLNPDGSLQPSTYGFPTMPQLLLAHSGMRELPLTDALLKRVAPMVRSRTGSSRFWAHDRTIEVDTLRGACVAMRMQAVREVGLMTEVAIVGGEEVEWHRRFHQHGWKVIYFADASVIHYGSQTVRDGSRNLYPEYLKGALYFFRTGDAGITYQLFCVSLLAVFGARRLVAMITRNASEATVAKTYASVAWAGLRGRLD